MRFYFTTNCEDVWNQYRNKSHPSVFIFETKMWTMSMVQKTVYHLEMGEIDLPECVGGDG